MNERFYLIETLPDGTETTMELPYEPDGYDQVDFSIKKGNNRYGMDVLFAGSDFNLNFKEHYLPEAFEMLLRNYESYGFEADIKFKVEIGSQSFIGNLDFQTAEYNGVDTFSISVIGNTSDEMLKRNDQIQVNFDSVRDLNDKPTSWQVISKQMFIPAKKVDVKSVWEQQEADVSAQLTAGAYNRIKSPTQYDIRNSLSWFRNDVSPLLDVDWRAESEFKLIYAKEDLTDITIDIDFNGSYIDFRTLNPNDNFLDLQIVVKVGGDPQVYSDWYFNTNTYYTDLVYVANITNQIIYLQNKTINIPNVEAGQSVWLYFKPTFFRAMTSPSTQVRVLNKSGQKVTVTAQKKNYDIVTPVYNLHDVVKKVVWDSANLDIDFPSALSGELKNQYITNGNKIRGIDKPILMSFDEIKKWLPELNMDYKILNNNKVFFGFYPDFYKFNELDVLTEFAPDTYKMYQNLKFCINKVKYHYDKYQSQKENTRENTNDIIHGEAEYHIRNKQVDDVLDIAVGWVRDSFMLQKTIDDAIDYNEGSATQDDDTVFIISGADIKPSDKNIQKTALLYHRKISETNLTLTTTDFRWSIIGVEPTSIFEITTVENMGTYEVYSVSDNVIELIKINANLTFTGEKFTRFKYVLSNLVTLKPDFLPTFSVNNLISPSTFVNQAFSVRSNLNRWQNYISSAMINTDRAVLKDYKNNKDMTRQLIGVGTNVFRENADILKVQPILNTEIIETTAVIDFQRYLELINMLRSKDSGLIRVYDPKGNAKYLFPLEMNATPLTSNLRSVIIKGELLFMPDTINVTKTNGRINIFIHRNESMHVSNNGDYVQFYDDNGNKIYKSIRYDKVSVNGNYYGDVNSLLIALELLS